MAKKKATPETPRMYTFLKNHRITTPKYMFLKKGGSGILDFPESLILQLKEAGIIEEHVETSSNEASDDASHLLSSNNQITDELPDEYGKKEFPCKNPKCPYGRNIDGEAGPYKRQIDLDKHYKKNSDCREYEG